MTNRKRRLKKGIKSLEIQIKLHKEKLEEARKNKRKDLEEYYSREIEARTKTKEEKEELLDKT